jgi:lipase maturation factor 1
VFLDAWFSLGVQVRELIGSHGLLPVASYFEIARQHGEPGFWEFPTVFWLDASDGTLTAGIVVGVLLALASLAGFWPRACFAASTILYLSYATACRTFLWFQWDNMLIECGLLVLLLPGDRPARGAHLLFRLLLFKLYWESGIAKWQSYLHDWQDGSAMTFYYETAPLPTWLAWYAHNLPAWWHHIESRAALAFELVVPFLMFGPRRVRLTAFGILTGFQFIDAATANYGYFCYLSGALHVFLLDDTDIERITKWGRSLTARVLRRPVAEPSEHVSPPLKAWREKAGKVGLMVVTTGFLFISVAEGLFAFADVPRLHERLEPLESAWQPFRLVNTYHLFGHITRERIEPEFQTYDGVNWSGHDFRHKAGDVNRAPDFVAPHQPRVDFQLWFYGLGFQRGAPDYVVSLIERLCHDPPAIQGLFVAPLPAKPQSVRLAFWQYHFTTPEERSRTGAWWKRQMLGTTRPIDCSRSDLEPD